MIKSYFTIAFRNITRNKVASFINIFGLAIGISSCILIFMFVRNERGYDKKNPNADRIYRVISDLKLTGQTDRLAMSSFMLSPTIKPEYPEIEHAIRAMPIPLQTIWNGSQVFQLKQVYFADSDFFAVFPYHFISGKPETALNEPYSIVLTEESAKLMFGTTENVLGRMLKFTRASYKVTGVVREPKNESHLYFSAVISISSLPKPYEQTLKTDWLHLAQSNYIMFRTKGQGDHFQPKLDAFQKKHIAPFLHQYQVQGNLSFFLQPLTEIHLGNKIHFDYADENNPAYLYIFSVIAIFILFIACVNYMNLATAKSAKRAKEVGIRKTAGAGRRQLIFQFMGESLLITIISVVLALCFAELLLPLFNHLTDKELSINFLDPVLVVFILSVILFIGFTSGIYPAFYLSGFQPIEVLKTNKMPKSGHALLRKILVVTQFCISIVLIVGTLVIWLQMHYVENKDMGFSKEQVYVIKAPIADSSFVRKYEDLKHEFLQSPDITGVTSSNEVPGETGGSILQIVDYDNKREERLMNVLFVDHNFIPMMKIPMVAGRNFSKDFPSDDTAAFIINETAAKQFGWKKPLDVKIYNGLGFKGRVIGVMKDFNYTSLHKPIEPLVLMLSRNLNDFVLLKVKPDNLHATISFIDQKWKMFSKRYPMESFFLDENFNKQYRSEDKMLTVFAYFSTLTIIIACLGLLALASYTAEQRTKEIGIRKVMGAGVGNIIALISKDFIKLVLIAFIIAAPIAWFSMNKWLEDFAYRIDIPAWSIIVGGLLALVVALATVSFQAYKAASQNPVESIKAE